MKGGSIHRKVDRPVTGNRRETWNLTGIKNCLKTVRIASITSSKKMMVTTYQVRPLLSYGPGNDYPRVRFRSIIS